MPTDVRMPDVGASLPTPTHASLRHSPATAFEWVVLLGATAWVVALTFLRWPAPLYSQFDSNSTIDSAFFALAGRMVRDGQVPYVAFWDHKPPLIYLIDALALTLSGGAVWGIWLVTVAALVATLGMAWLAWRPTVGPTAAVIGIAWVACSLGIVAPFNLTEGFMLPVQAATMVVLARWSPLRHRAFAPGLAVGTLAGLAFMLRPNLIGTPAAVGATMVAALLLTGRTRRLPALVGGAIVGAALVVAPILIWLGTNGALGAFREQVFHYNAVYSAASWFSRARAAFEGVAQTTTYGTLLLPIIGWLVAAHRFVVRRRSATPKPVLLFAVLWAPLEVALAAVPGRPYMHYFALLLLPLGLLTAIAAYEAFVLVARAGAPTVTERWRRHAAAVVCAAIAIVPFGRTVIGVRDSGLRRERAEQVETTAQYVRAHSPMNSRLLVWGHASDVYLFANRAPASRFVYPLAMLTPRYATDTLVAAFIEDLQTSAPPLIVDATPGGSSSDVLVPSLSGWDPTWQYPESGVAWWTMTPALRAFYDHVATNYAIIDSVGPQHWIIYARRSDLDKR
jgi:4-amino-4-deoxy-L-arabinose transferase-like glycosyltransferase